MGVAFVFPGQGAQYVGMGQELADSFAVAKETFAEADDALQFALSRVFLAGPETDLRLTYYTQPAILAVSIAAWRVFSVASKARPARVAGHSLGEYTALVAAGAIPFADALRLVHLRGRFMDEAVPAGLGAMAAVLGATPEDLKALCVKVSLETGQVVEVANVNCPGQLVVSGLRQGVEQLVARAPESGARKAIMLDVSGPFHSSLMAAAAEKLEKRLAAQVIHPPACPVVANVNAQSLLDATDIRAALAQQVASPVLWEASIRHMVDVGIHSFVEFGPGTVLSGLIRKTHRAARTWHVENRATLDETLRGLAQEGSSA